MVRPEDFDSQRQPTWCPGCGNFAIWNALKRALARAEVAPHEVVLYTGIGCGSKIPDYMRVNGFAGIHGRPIAVAQGARLANHRLKAVVVAGDGDTYGMGGNHLVHALRRNVDITIMVQNNRVYGLTKGQYSPTSPAGFASATSPAPTGSIDQPINPLALALAAGATFIARSWSGDLPHLTEVMTAAIKHRGASLLDILQPCVTFNRRFGYDFYRQRVYDVGSSGGYDPSDRDAAWEKAQQDADRIPIGIILSTEGRPTYEEQVPALRAGPLAERPLIQWNPEDLRELENEFM